VEMSCGMSWSSRVTGRSDQPEQHSGDPRREPRWSPDGKTIALNTKPKKATVYDITLMDWATRKMTPLTHESTPNHLWQSVAWSSDGKTLLCRTPGSEFYDADVTRLTSQLERPPT